MLLGLTASPVPTDDTTATMQREEQEWDQAAVESGRLLEQYAPELGSDEAITHEVSEVLNGDPAIRGIDIEVRTEAGVVYLKGEVPDELVLSRAIELASTVPGVRRVDSVGLHIKV
ncbi:MAG TPA: BON domain-containing protein [Xanthomonadaceae bacterium]|nr:BON domain-containing protein [Xanthomonadaceae bacterium]